MRLIGTVDPDVVVRKIAKLKKHVKVSAVTHPQTHHMPPPENHHGMTQPPPPPNGLTCSHPPPSGGPTNGPPLAHGDPTQGRPPPPSHPTPHHGHSCPRSGCDHVPPTPAVALPTGQPPRQSVHKHAAEKGKSPSCHHPPSRHTCVNGPPAPPVPSCHHHHPPPRHSCVNGSRQRTQHLHNCHEPPPPSGHRFPPPQHNHNAATHHPPPQNNPADQLDKFIHGSSSPLIPRSILGHLAKIPKQKNVELIQKKGIKFRFQDGHVKSSHPINHMEFRPGHNLPQHHQQPPPPRHFSDENLNSSCTIM